MSFPVQDGRSVVCRAAVVLLPAALYFSVVADLPHVLLLTVAAFGVAIAGRGGWPISDRTVIYSVVAALIMTAFGNYLVPMKPERFGFMAFFMRPALLVPFFLYMAALASGFRRKELAVGFAAGSALFAFGVGGDVRIDHLATERWPGIDFDLPGFCWFYGVTAGISVLGAVFGSRSMERAPWSRRSILLVLPALVLAGGLTYGGFRAYRAHETVLRSWENALLRLGVRQLYRGAERRRMQLGGSPRLNTPFPPYLRAMGNQVALRAVGEAPPGYLRCRAFSSYKSGGWDTAGESRRDMVESEMVGEGIAAAQLYKLSRLERAAKQWLFIPGEKLSGSDICYPGGAVSFELMADQVSITPEGRIEPENMVRDAGYTFYADSVAPETSYPLPETPGPEFTAIPERLKPTLRNLSLQLGLQKLPDDRSRFDRAVDFFNDNFQYSLDWRGTEHGEEPLRVFLLEERRGHCELFASALAMLLRDCGIPTRYVSGVVCFERHPSGRYYIARFRNAHAWVEAYDRERKQWVMLDATPASVTAAPAPAEGWRDRFDSEIDYWKLLWQQLLSDLRRGKVAAAIIGFAVMVWQVAAALVLHPVTGPLLGLAAVWLAARWWRRRLKPVRLLAADRRKVQRQFFALCRKLRREHILTGASEPTAAELMALLREHPALPPERRRELLDWLSGYLRQRYGVADQAGHCGKISD